jgi:hypothetical protein
VIKAQSKELKRKWRVLAYAIGLLRVTFNPSSLTSISTTARERQVDW